MMTMAYLRGQHPNIIFTDWPHHLWNRVIIQNRKQRLKKKYNDNRRTIRNQTRD